MVLGEGRVSLRIGGTHHHHRGRPGRRRQMRHAGVIADITERSRRQRRDLGEVQLINPGDRRGPQALAQDADRFFVAGSANQD